MIQEHIHSLLPKLTKSEKKLALFINADLQDIPNYTINHVATTVGIAESTVIRFCRKLGFSGFQDFKTSLLKELVAREMNPFSIYEEEMSVDDDISASIAKIQSGYSHTIELTKKQIDPNQIAQIMQHFMAAQKVRFYGIGISDIPVQEAIHRFLRIVDHVQGFYSGHSMMIDASKLNAGDLVFAFSYSGSTKDIVDAIKVAKGNGAIIVSITHYLQSPITQYSDFTLWLMTSDNALIGGSIFQKTSQLFILDIIYIEFLKRIDQSKIIKLTQTLKTLDNKFYDHRHEYEIKSRVHNIKK